MKTRIKEYVKFLLVYFVIIQARFTVPQHYLTWLKDTSGKDLAGPEVSQTPNCPNVVSACSENVEMFHHFKYLQLAFNPQADSLFSR